MIAETSPRRTIWVDVEDLFTYFAAHPRPSGVQRLVFETLKVLPGRAALLPGSPRIAFVRHGSDDRLLREVPCGEVARLFDAPEPSRELPRRNVATGGRPSIAGRLRLRAKTWIGRLPPAISSALLHYGVLQLGAFRAAQMLLSRHRPDHRTPSATAPTVAEPGFDGRPGDLLLVLGAAWHHRDYGELLRRLRDERQIGSALLAYDLIPVLHPEWCSDELETTFASWLQATLPIYTHVMAISRATARDVETYASRLGIALPGPVVPIRIGTGFETGPERAGDADQIARGLPAAGSYVLFVSTLEARKNHALLVRVWRRLLSDLPRAKVPTLVFAGRVGWLVADLLQQLDNADWMDGKIRLLRDPTDLELSALYRGCRFTLFPSLFEGWGLPVSESLEHGCPCIASNRTSLPEVGGDLVRYFDPENVEDAYRVIRGVIEDPAGLAAWRARIGTDFHPVPWTDTADDILAACLPSLTPQSGAIAERRP